MNDKTKHLEIIQGVITRMANNSFLLKGWSVILVSALFALSVKNANIHFIYLTYFPTLAFWVLDGYFLWQERLYRKLYDQVRLMKDSDIDFSMDTSSVVNQVSTWREVAFSKTIIIYHGSIIGTISLVMLIAISVS